MTLVTSRSGCPTIDATRQTRYSRAIHSFGHPESRESPRLHTGYAYSLRISHLTSDGQSPLFILSGGQVFGDLESTLASQGFTGTRKAKRSCMSVQIKCVGKKCRIYLPLLFFSWLELSPGGSTHCPIPSPFHISTSISSLYWQRGSTPSKVRCWDAFGSWEVWACRDLEFTNRASWMYNCLRTRSGWRHWPHYPKYQRSDDERKILFPPEPILPARA